MACITEEHAEFIWITLNINPRVWWERITEREFQDSVILETPRMPREYRKGIFRVIFENLEELPGKPPCCQIQVNSQAWAHLISGECKSQFKHSIIKHMLSFVSKHQILLLLWLLSLCLHRFFFPFRWWRDLSHFCSQSDHISSEVPSLPLMTSTTIYVLCLSRLLWIKPFPFLGGWEKSQNRFVVTSFASP